MKTKPSFQSLASSLPKGKAIRALAKEMALSDDRGTAIAAGSYLDHVLHLSIFMCINQTSKDPPNDPLIKKAEKTLALDEKILLCRKIRMFGQVTFNNLNTVRLIRNSFAHSVEPLTFRSASIQEKTQSLIWLRKQYRSQGTKFRSSRDRYITTVAEHATTIMFLSMLGYHTGSAPSGWIEPLP